MPDPFSPADPVRDVAILLLPGFSNLCLATTVEPLRAANQLAGERLYRWRLLSLDGGGVRTSSDIEINVAGEKSKYGIAVGAASHLIHHVAEMPGLKILGLMTMAPFVEDPEEVRDHFRRLREVLEDIRSEGVVGPDFRELSMGMTNDFEVAIEEGATMVRVGRALFEDID